MNVFALKIVALIAMIIDHSGAVFPSTPDWFRMIGRIAFPIYMYLIAEGARRTRDMRKYVIRLGLFALISEIPFDLAFNSPAWRYGGSIFSGIDFLRDTNVFYTLFFAALLIYAFRLAKERYRAAQTWAIAVAAAFAGALAADALRTDYGYAGVITIFAVYLTENKGLKLAALLAGISIIYLDSITVIGYIIYSFSSAVLAVEGLGEVAATLTPRLPMFICACAPLALLALYNGRRGPKLKWFFYAAYPAHLAVLVVIRRLAAAAPLR